MYNVKYKSESKESHDDDIWCFYRFNILSQKVKLKKDKILKYCFFWKLKPLFFNFFLVQGNGVE